MGNRWEGNDEDDTLNVLDFPNAGRLSAYHSIFLLKADEQTEEGPEGLTMTVEDIGTSEITVRITNKSGEDFSYGGVLLPPEADRRTVVYEYR